MLFFFRRKYGRLSTYLQDPENKQKKHMIPVVFDTDITCKKKGRVQYEKYFLEKNHQQALISSIIISHTNKNYQKKTHPIMQRGKPSIFHQTQ